MDFTTRRNAFIQLGHVLADFVSCYPQGKDNDTRHNLLRTALTEAGQYNPWFTEDNVLYALRGLSLELAEDHLDRWFKAYPELQKERENKRTVGVVMAGNIPMVGFHDLLCVVMSGHCIKGKCSSKDDKLLKAIVTILYEIEPHLQEYIILTDDFLKEYDAMIATGSNNSARYFEYYFRDVPHIIRKNRNAVAILNGNETSEQLHRLADDIFLYFGLGCRSVSKVYVPHGYDFGKLLPSFEHWHDIIFHHHYANNYEYNRAIYLVNRTPFLDNGFLLLKEDHAISSPVSVLYYETYQKEEDIQAKLQEQEDNIQCIVSDAWDNKVSVPFGKAQHPDVWDYADGIDTLRFLLNL